MSKKISKEERKKALQEQTKQNVENKGKSGGKGKSILDFSKYEGKVEFFKPKEGNNAIDIIPYIVQTKHHPKKVKPGYESYLLDIYEHFDVGPAKKGFVCLNRTYGKACPICEEYAQLVSDGAKESITDPLKAKRRVLYNVIDLSNDSDKILLFESSYYLFEKELLEEIKMSDDEFITFADIEDGKSITFRAVQEQLNNVKFFKYKRFDFEDRDPYPESILEEAYSLDEMLIVPTYDEVKEAFYGIDEDDEEVEQEIEEEPPTQKRRKRKSIQEKEEESQSCPANHVFGNDNDAFEDCDECDIWEKCLKKYEENNDK